MPSNTCQHPVTGKEAEEPGLGGRASTLFPDDASLFIHPSDGLGRPDRCPHSGKGSRLLREGSHMEEVSLCYACWGWQKQVKDWGGGDPLSLAKCITQTPVHGKPLSWIYHGGKLFAFRLNLRE
jgi:hypothetical protein